MAGIYKWKTELTSRLLLILIYYFGANLYLERI